MNNIDRARTRMAGDFRAIILDGEDLLKAVAAVSGDTFAGARGKLEGRLTRARTTLSDATQPILEKSRVAAECTDTALRENAWTAVGLAVALGALIGFFASKR
jgi:ElaB/YqjD/DUF883 family membrane-anchored ribosome-binding protein